MTPAIANPPATQVADGPAKDHYFDYRSAQIRYRDVGIGPPVVLVHGWTLDLEMWDVQAAQLQRAFRVVRYDRRGFGRSFGQPSAAQDCEDLVALCDHLALGCVALVGMSQGVRPVLQLAASAPKRVACLVLDGPPDLEAAAEEVDLSRYRALARAQGVDAFRREWARHPLMQLRASDPSVHQSLQAILERYPGIDLTDRSLGRGATATLFQPDSVLTPALVISGEYDIASRVQAADRLATRLPHGERAIIPGAGHLANFDNPCRYTQITAAFLARHAIAPS